jgi:hypothetical protein
MAAQLIAPRDAIVQRVTDLVAENVALKAQLAAAQAELAEADANVGALNSIATITGLVLSPPIASTGNLEGTGAAGTV